MVGRVCRAEEAVGTGALWWEVSAVFQTRLMTLAHTVPHTVLKVLYLLSHFILHASPVHISKWRNWGTDRKCAQDPPAGKWRNPGSLPLESACVIFSPLQTWGPCSSHLHSATLVLSGEEYFPDLNVGISCAGLELWVIFSLMNMVIWDNSWSWFYTGHWIFKGPLICLAPWYILSIIMNYLIFFQI